MQPKQIETDFWVSAQPSPGDLPGMAERGIRTLICNRPDGEGADQPTFTELEEAATACGIRCVYQPVISGKVSDADAEQFAATLAREPRPILACCRSGTRSTTLWTLAEGHRGRPLDELVRLAKDAGYDMSKVAERVRSGSPAAAEGARQNFDVVIVGGGAAGIAAAASLLAREADLSLAIIEPAEVHYYQPGWTLVGAGIFEQASTVKTMASLIPSGVSWIRGAVASFEPEHNQVVLEDCERVRYQRLIVAPGLKLNWHAVEGLAETLGHNGVTSNYRFDLAPYTWKLVRELPRGRALFTQPPMPIKCAGAPQKAMYLSSDYWLRKGRLDAVDVEFYNAGPALFGVKEYVLALMKYVERYDAALNFGHTLTRIDGPARKAWFRRVDENGQEQLLEREFDMIHVCPPQAAPDFIASSPLADASGWVDVDQNTLRHRRYTNIWSLGDAMNAPNAKTAAAARMQAPVVANNLLHDAGLANGVAHYNGYGSCPLTVERGRIVLAEFGYGGKLLPSFPRWLIDGTRPSRLAWLLKEKILPPVYWKAMLRGHEWLASPVAETESQ